MEIQKWRKKKEKAQIEGNSDSVYFACKELAELYFNSEKFDLALQEYKEMEHISEVNNNRLDVGRANRMIGEVYCEKGEFDKALKHQMKHLVISRDEDNKVEEQRALATLGRTYFLKAESIVDVNSGSRDLALCEAKKYYLESLAVCNKLVDSDVGNKQRMEMIARLFLNIGLVLDCQNQFESAIDYMQKAVSICKKLDLWEDLYRTYLALGAAYHRHSDSNHSIKTYDLALSVAERLSNKLAMMCEVLLLKADVLLELPDMRGARQVLVKAYRLKVSSRSLQANVEKKLRIVAAMCECEEKLMELNPESDDAERKKLYEEIGDAATELNNFKLALTYYHLMLECVEKCGREEKALIDSYISLAQTYKDDQQYTKALEYFQKELELEDTNSPEACKTLLNIADIYQLMGRREEMYAAYSQAKHGALNSSDTKLKKAVLTSLYAALIEDNKIATAGEVKRELDGIVDGFPDDSSDEEEEVPRQFGAHIALDDLTDDEGGHTVKDGEDRSRQQGRSRSRRMRAPNIEKRNEKGETPLHVAAIQGNSSLALKLIEQGHRVDVKDNSGWTPLHEACNHGHIDVVRLLLEHGAPVNDRGGPHCDGLTPLLDAASNGNLDIVQVLLNHGASPLMRTNSGETVIDCLSGWRRRRYDELGVDISGSTLAQYSTIYKQLAQVLEKAGQKLSSSDDSEPRKERRRESVPEKSATQTSSSQEKHSKAGVGQERQRKKSNSPLKGQHSMQTNRENPRKAATEYENAMKALRFRNNRLDLDPSPEANDWHEAKSGRALLGESEIVGDDWLIDDLEESRPNKKRRTGELNHDLVGGKQSRHTGRSHHEARSRIVDSPEASSSSEDDASEQSDGASRSNDDRPESESSSTPTYLSSSSNRAEVSDMNTLKRKQVPSLSSKNKWFTNGANSRNNDSTTVDEPTAFPNLHHTPPTLSAPQQPYSCVKVRIEDKVVIVPVPASGGHSLTISWLAAEAAARYKSLEGVEPVVQLEMDGGLLVGSDPLSIVTLTPGAIIDGKVLSWKLISLTSLYEETCTSLNTKCDSDVKCAVEGCQATGAVSVEDMYLSWSTLSPFLRALSHYQPLQKLSLASNNISDTNILEVGECVSKLPQLKELDLSNTNITEKGLEMFAQAVLKVKGLQKLEVLKLGYNPLGDCLRPLTILLDSARFVRHLSLPDIGLTSRSFSSGINCSLDCIEILELNYNEIGREGVREIMGLLESDRVKELHVARCGAGVVREIGFYLEQQAPRSLRSIDLSYCPASSDDIHQFLRGARLCQSLEKICFDGLDRSEESVAQLLDLPLCQLDVCGINNSSPSLLLPHHLHKLVISTSQQINTSNSVKGPYGLVISAK